MCKINRILIKEFLIVIRFKMDFSELAIDKFFLIALNWFIILLRWWWLSIIYDFGNIYLLFTILVIFVIMNSISHGSIFLKYPNFIRSIDGGDILNFITCGCADVFLWYILHLGILLKRCNFQLYSLFNLIVLIKLLQARKIHNLI